MIYYYPGLNPSIFGGSEWVRDDAPGRQVLYPKNDKGTNVVIGDDNDLVNGISYRFKAIMGRATFGLNDDGVNGLAGTIFIININEQYLSVCGDFGIQQRYDNFLINKDLVFEINNLAIQLTAVIDNGGPAQKDTILEQDENNLNITASDAATAESVRFGIGANNGIFFQELVSTTKFFGMKPNGQMFEVLPAFDDDAAAGAGGLVVNDKYQTTGAGAAPLNVAGIQMIKQ